MCLGNFNKKTADRLCIAALYHRSAHREGVVADRVEIPIALRHRRYTAAA